MANTTMNRFKEMPRLKKNGAWNPKKTEMKVQETHHIADKWKRLTGMTLRDFVDIMPDGDVMPNTTALEGWLSPKDNESIEECLCNRHGQAAVNIIEQLFSSYRTSYLVKESTTDTRTIQLTLF